MSTCKYFNDPEGMQLGTPGNMSVCQPECEYMLSERPEEDAIKCGGKWEKCPLEIKQDEAIDTL